MTKAVKVWLVILSVLTVFNLLLLFGHQAHFRQLDYDVGVHQKALEIITPVLDEQSEVINQHTDTINSIVEYLE